MSYFAKLNEKLDEGWVMSNMSCEDCKVRSPKNKSSIGVGPVSYGSEDSNVCQM
jgi:hypothetical protein